MTPKPIRKAASIAILIAALLSISLPAQAASPMDACWDRFVEALKGWTQPFLAGEGEVQPADSAQEEPPTLKPPAPKTPGVASTTNEDSEIHPSLDPNG